MQQTKPYFITTITTIVLFAAHSLVLADLAVGIQAGTLRNTSTPGQWRTKYLGGPHFDIGSNAGQPDTSFDWAAQRTYHADGTLDTSNAAGYGPAYSISPNISNDAQYWARNPLVDWISASNDGIGPNGYYSFVTTIDDTFNQLGRNQSLTLCHLSLTFASDENVQAIVINGVRYLGFAAQSPNFEGWFPGNDTTLSLSDISHWNINGLNTIEFVVYNAGLTNIGTYTLNDNPFGLAANIQAFYHVTNNPPSHAPEPATLLLWAFGSLGMAGTSWARNRWLKHSA